MPHDKAIEHVKEHRKPYYGSKAIDLHCRNHGLCVWCERGRQAKHRRSIAQADEQIRELDEASGDIDKCRHFDKEL